MSPLLQAAAAERRHLGYLSERLRAVLLDAGYTSADIESAMNHLE